MESALEERSGGSSCTNADAAVSVVVYACASAYRDRSAHGMEWNGRTVRDKSVRLAESCGIRRT
jgi:hypothetical protein